MNLTLALPDDLAERLGADGEVLSRRALEAFASEEYRAGRLTAADLRRLLDFGTPGEVDGFLRARGIVGTVTPADHGRLPVAHPGTDAGWRAFDRTLIEVRGAFAELSTGELDVLIDEAVAAVREDHAAKAG